MSDERLFERGDHGERHGTEAGDNTPVEHQHLPAARHRDAKPPTVVFSFETPEQREELLAVLGIKASRSTEQWVAWWPEPPDDGKLTFDLGME